MSWEPLPFLAATGEYEAQAAELLQAFRSGAPEAAGLFHHHHPKFLDSEVRWLPRRISDDEILQADLSLEDARLAIARVYCFEDWAALLDHVREVTRAGSAVNRFETAVEAVIGGDRAGLERLLASDPDLVRARSARVTNFDPPVHRATLLHYIAANGVEGYRQKSPPNAVEIADVLLRAGAEPDALAGMYGGECTTMSMLVSSSPPADAGVQIGLIDKLVDHGASVEAAGSGNWASPLMTAIVFGFREAAEALIRRGARVDRVEAAAGLGRIDDVRRLLPQADTAARHRAFALSAQQGHAEVVRLLLDAGEDPDRFNPEGTHAHATALHQAALAGHLDVVRLLVERGARIDIRDKLWQGTPLNWALHNQQAEVAAYLRSRA
ncbi:MAG: ankyrin repeat domain-containing protein [Bryobacteraceae bacterium]|nr:ankyrin repeat domain-containing protein [Bryobacteraceae bacterium]